MTRIIIPFCLLITFCVFGEGATAVENISGKQSDSLLTRPSTADISEAIESRKSFLPQKVRQSISAEICEIDIAHLAYSEKNNFKTTPPDDNKEWFRSTSQECPSLTPSAERAIFCALAAQITMLDQLLRQKKPALARQLETERRVIRVKDKKDGFFGDGRDLYLGLLLERIKNINKLQRGLGATGDSGSISIHPGASKDELISILLRKLYIIRQNAVELESQS